jgi:hypothetical protein
MSNVLSVICFIGARLRERTHTGSIAVSFRAFNSSAASASQQVLGSGPAGHGGGGGGGGKAANARRRILDHRLFWSMDEGCQVSTDGLRQKAARLVVFC